MNDMHPKRPKPPLDFDEAPELTEEMFARARPASEVHGPERSARMLRPRGRPSLPENERKQQVTLRLSPDVLAALRESGEGWQTRVDDILRAAVLPARDEQTLIAEAKEQFRAAKAAGTSLFERMANLSRDVSTGHFAGDSNATDGRKSKKRA